MTKEYNRSTSEAYNEFAYVELESVWTFQDWVKHYKFSDWFDMEALKGVTHVVIVAKSFDPKGDSSHSSVRLICDNGAILDMRMGIFLARFKKDDEK